MARLRHADSTEASESDTLYRDSSVAKPAGPLINASAPQASPSDKRTTEDIEQVVERSSSPPTLNVTLDHGRRTMKRRRVDGDTDRSLLTGLEDGPDARFYDPNQDADERRETRKGLRKIYKDVCDNRHEYLQPESTGLHDALHRLNRFQSTVKQTSDATIDSRTLVDVGDLTFRKTQRLVLRESSQGVDVDEFVSKCVTFMRRWDTDDDHQHSFLAERRRLQGGNANSEDEDHDSGDAFNWALLGSHACLQWNTRPAVTGFLLGPLSVQKKARSQRSRRGILQHRVSPRTTQPQELKESDLENSENSNLVNICRSVLSRLKQIKSHGQREANKEYRESMSTDEEAELLKKHNLCDDSGVSLMSFAINPQSFGQTVENLFYISFLIKDGYIGIDKDSHNTPTLHIIAHNEDGEGTIRTKQSKKHQGIFSLDYSMWKELVRVYDIQESLIPHRMDAEKPLVVVGDTGWY